MQNYQDTELMAEEIDLISVIKNSKRNIDKWKKTVFYFIIVGLVSGLLYYFIAPKKYKSRMFVSSTLLKGPSFVVIVDDLQRHFKEENYGEVARLLNLDSVVVSKIDKIQVYSVKNFAEKEFSDVITQEEAIKEVEDMTGEFIIEAFVKDSKILKQLKKGLVFYLNNNEYIKQKSLERKQNLKSVKNRVHNEINGLDSLKNSLSAIYSGSNKGNASSLSINDPSAIYSNIIGLYQTELNTEAALNSPDISIVQGFIPYIKPNSPKLWLSLLTGFFGILCACYDFCYLQRI